MIKLSAIIPSWKDPYLIRTVDSLLEASQLGDQLEIIVVLDGYWPAIELRQDSRVRYTHLGKNRGMRDAINAGVSIARGEFIMRSDEHVMFSPGFDKILVEACQPNWIMTARRFFLDPVNWKIMDDIPYVDYEKLKIRDDIKFEGQRWRTRDRKRRDVLIDETMAMQGSVWLMLKAWWEKVIVKLQTEGYGPLYQDSHEMCFKTWQAGGKLMLHKGAWFAHKHYRFPRTHSYGDNVARPGWTYSLNLWRTYYEAEIRPLWEREHGLVV